MEDPDTMNAPAPYRILVVCSGNTCRSSMAEALLRDALARQWPAGLERIEVRSAGTMAAPGLPASEHAVTALRELNLDISGHRSQPLTLELLGQSALVLTMTRGHKAQVQRQLASGAPQVFTLLEYAHAGEPWGQQDIPDPFGAALETYRSTASALARAMERVVQRLRQELTAAGPAAERPNATDSDPGETTNSN